MTLLNRNKPRYDMIDFMLVTWIMISLLLARSVSEESRNKTKLQKQIEKGMDI